jgi:hypothetical protein
VVNQVGLDSIPKWTGEGLIPPIDDRNPTGRNRSPYRVGLKEFIARFATTSPRMKILDGYLRLRKLLHEHGFCSGFQWVNGSFVENAEAVRGRPPMDIDVVSFLAEPALTTNLTVEDALDADMVKNSFFVDHYMVELNLPSRLLVREAAYWFGVWSHRRTTNQWKGFLQIDLEADEDEEASRLLQRLRNSGGET